jgi:hypothetical protein
VLACVNEVLYESITRSGSPAPLPTTVEKIVKMLLAGDRSGACRLAIESELWSHALVLSGAGFDQGLYRDAMLWFSRSITNVSVAVSQSTHLYRKNIFF